MNLPPVLSRTGETVVLETDICTDVDDVAALSLLCGEAKAHPEAFRLGGVSCNVRTPFAAPAVKTILSAWGLEGVPVGVTEDEPPPSGNRSSYLPGLAARWRGGDPAASGTGRELYRRVLAKAADRSVTVISIGFFNTLDEVFAENPSLFRRKVRAVYAMAGGFASKAGMAEFNVKGHADAARRFVDAWDGPIVFCGFECGETVMTDLSGLPAAFDSHPLVEAFRYHRGPCMKRSSWDPITADLALVGENECYELGPVGRVRVSPDAATVFTPDPEGNARVLRFRAPEDAVSARITARVRAAAGLPPRA